MYCMNIQMCAENEDGGIKNEMALRLCQLTQPTNSAVEH
jgi:hypothetical protein